MPKTIFAKIAGAQARTAAEARRAPLRDKSPFQQAMQGVLLLSFCVAAHVFIVGLLAHFVMLDFSAANGKMDEMTSRFLTNASEIFKKFWMLSFFAPWLCFLYKKYSVMKRKIAFALGAGCCVLAGGFFVYIYYTLGVISILPGVLYHFLWFAMYALISMVLAAQIILINNDWIAGGFRVKLTLFYPAYFFILIVCIVTRTFEGFLLAVVHNLP